MSDLAGNPEDRFSRVTRVLKNFQDVLVLLSLKFNKGVTLQETG